MRLSKGLTSARLLRLLRLGRSRTSLKSSLRSASMRGMVRAARSGRRDWSRQLLPAVQAARDASSGVCGSREGYGGRGRAPAGGGEASGGRGGAPAGRAGLRRAGAVPREREGGRLCRGLCSARADAAPLRPRAAPAALGPAPRSGGPAPNGGGRGVERSRGLTRWGQIRWTLRSPLV